ncbi:uncharacterized protein [Triticum aestivum]|uniref:uncharacterized protein n=1 Tax=Triticum aestivum TaxID=4565 RepID=UPI001D01C66D|nr:uncharacterized protein LOC123160973 [Triticum aestivum]
MDPSGAFVRSSRNVLLASLVRSGTGGISGSGSSRGRGGAGGSQTMVRRVLHGVITFIFAIASSSSSSWRTSKGNKGGYFDDLGMGVPAHVRTESRIRAALSKS